MQLPVVAKPKGRITEREVRAAGVTSNRRRNLIGALAQGIKGGSLTVSTRNGSQSLALTSIDTEALIGLLLERDEAFLIGLDIELDTL